MLTISSSNLCYGLLVYPDFDKQFERSDIVVVGYVEKTDSAHRIDKDGNSSSDYWSVYIFRVENVLKGEDNLKNIYILDKNQGISHDFPSYIENKKQLLFLIEVKLSDTERAERRLLVVTEDKSSNKKRVELKRLLEGKYFETPFWRNGTIILDDDKLESKVISDEAKEFIRKMEKKKEQIKKEKVPVKKD